MKKLIGLFSIGLLSLSAFAGYNGGSQVVIAGDLAYGSYRDVRYSADATQYISCYSQHPLGGVTYGVCQARNSAGTYRSCSTTDPAMIGVIQSLGSTTDYAWFRTNAAGSCTRISAVSASFNL